MTETPHSAVSHTPDAALVAELIRTQAPEFAALPFTSSNATGSSNWVLRLGDDLSVRLPRSRDYVDDLATEVQWLPTIHSTTTTPFQNWCSPAQSREPSLGRGPS